MLSVVTRIGSIVLDASVSEQHQGEVEVTEHPVEVGANVSDHARARPDSITIEGLISDTPATPEQTERALDDGGTVQIEPVQVQAVPGYAKSVYQKLVELKDARQLVTVETGLRTYDNMILTSLSAPRDSQTGDALRFTAAFRQVRMVSNRMTLVQTATTSTPRGKKKAKKGHIVTRWVKEGEATVQRYGQALGEAARALWVP